MSKRYRPFLSYSLRDKGIAKRVHRALENYRLLRGLPVPGLDPKSRKD
jgi:hypothetical protein